MTITYISGCDDTGERRVCVGRRVYFHGDDLPTNVLRGYIIDNIIDFLESPDVGVFEENEPEL